VGGAPRVRKDSLYVGRVYGQEVQLQKVHPADGSSTAAGLAPIEELSQA
jgi:hypothetical protein